MRPADYIASLFKPSGGPGGESAAYDFDPIGSYFYNCPAEEGVFQIVDAETTADLDLNAVFEKIDRTTSRVGQQYLYARLRTLRGEEDAADFDRRVGAFENDDELTQRCAGHLARLAGDDASDLCRLIFDTPVRVRRIGLIYALTAAAAAALLLAPFVCLCVQKVKNEALDSAFLWTIHAPHDVETYLSEHGLRPDSMPVSGTPDW